MARVSILIPTHNDEMHVTKSISSALDQTYEDCEVIVINDGSTDGTAQAVEKFGDRILYVEQGNLGVAAARNAGLKEATGDIIALLDADDFWLPHKVRTMVSFLEDRPALALAVCDSYLVHEQGSSGATFYDSRPKRLGFRWTDQKYWIIQYNFIFNPGVIFRRQSADQASFFNESLRSLSDWDLWIRRIGSGAKAGFLQETLGYYRLRTNSISADPKRTIGDEIRILEMAANNPNYADCRGVRGRLIFAMAKRALIEGSLPESVELFRKATSDAGLPSMTRLRSRLAALAPRTARKSYSLRLSSVPARRR